MPFPSHGCSTCKRRRVKCDETRPICGQCKKRNRHCWGYSGYKGDLKFLSENVYAGGRRRRPRGRLMNDQLFAVDSSHEERKHGEEPFGTPPESVFISGTPIDQNNFSIVKPLNLPLSVYATYYYVSNHTDYRDNLPEISNGHAKYIPSRWIRSNPESAFHLVMTAISHATFGRAKHSAAAVAEGHKIYQQALSYTKRALNDALQVMSDELLLTVMVMCTYENTVFSPKDSENMPIGTPDSRSRFSRSFYHHEGAAALLKLRVEQEMSKESLVVSKVVRRGLVSGYHPCMLFARDLADH
ncbi:hypothetical protein NA57DRAFT_57005 [Rhizodiscina lignyota]|uniref:Zn(2)-C6 fungal-type domain-containing protein n=1 Tax=Rhizodiscina lignyota TaxID=1504668 RepID=A0A9P4IDT1_9PEZI|nr:hypothetical protein NA57DRAFT_57005 [Rhizodiscina lignyota]